MTAPVLDSIAERIGNDARIEITGSWEVDNNGTWNLPITASLSVAPTSHMPIRTAWRMVIGPNQPRDSVYLYPDVRKGVTSTFRHQDWNPEPDHQASWRSGKPCLERPIAGLGRDDLGDEPAELEDAAVWKTGRLLQWIDAAATGSLADVGDPNELPAGLGQSSRRALAFDERSSGLDWYGSTPARWGLAKLASVPGASNTWVLAELSDQLGRSIRTYEWGTRLAQIEAVAEAIWLTTDVLPVLEPWDAPKTWAELSTVLGRDGVDLPAIVCEMGATCRRNSSPMPRRLMIGFPFAERVGAQPNRLHWLAVGDMPLTRRGDKRKGFRANEASWTLLDKQMATSRRPLAWMKTLNWASDQLQSRGGLASEAAARSVLVIGAGSLGSMVAENLCRSGIHDIGIVDGETLNAGNLVRHTLGTQHVGHLKASALAGKLNEISPHSRARSFPVEFSAELPTDLMEDLRRYEVVLDCTGSDEVLHHLAHFDWGEEKTFVSLSMTWRAEGMLAFVAKEAAFPEIDAKTRFHEADTPVVDPKDSTVEAIGCWHPVFPADAAQVALWAAIGAEVVERAIFDPTRRLIYHRRTENGGVELVHG